MLANHFLIGFISRHNTRSYLQEHAHMYISNNSLLQNFINKTPVRGAGSSTLIHSIATITIDGYLKNVELIRYVLIIMKPCITFWCKCKSGHRLEVGAHGEEEGDSYLKLPKDSKKIRTTMKRRWSKILLRSLLMCFSSEKSFNVTFFFFIRTFAYMG